MRQKADCRERRIKGLVTSKSLSGRGETMKQYNLNGLSGNGTLITNNHKESLIYFGSIFLEEQNLLLDYFKSLTGQMILKTTLTTLGSFVDLSFKRLEITTGEPGPSTDVVEKRRKELADARNHRFEEASLKIEEKFGKEACQLVLTRWANGSRIAIMEVVAGLDVKKEDLLFALKKSLGESPDFLAVMVRLVADWPNQEMISTSAQRAHAWKYLRDLGLEKYLPDGVNLLGEVLRAFRAYAEINPAELPKKKGKFAKSTVNALQEHFS